MNLLRDRWAEVVLGVLGAVALAVLVIKGLNPQKSADPVYCGKPLSYWLSQLHTRNRPAAETAIQGLGLKGVPFLLNAIWRGEQVEQAPQTALRLLGKSAVPGLVKAFRDPDEKVRLAAIRAVGALGTNVDRVDCVVSNSLVLLRDSYSEVRLETEFFLDRIGPSRVVAAPGIVSVLERKSGDDEDDRTDIQITALHILAQCGPAARSAVPVLLTLLADPKPGTKQQSVIALWNITHDLSLVMPELLRMLNGTDREYRYVAAGAILRINADSQLDPELVARAQRIRSGDDGENRDHSRQRRPRDGPPSTCVPSGPWLVSISTTCVTLPNRFTSRISVT